MGGPNNAQDSLQEVSIGDIVRVVRILKQEQREQRHQQLDTKTNSKSQQNTGRAVVATLGSGNGSVDGSSASTLVSVLWEPIEPRPLNSSMSTTATSKNSKSTKFIVAPHLTIRRKDNDDETLVDMKNLQRLLSFEGEEERGNETEEAPEHKKSVDYWKDCGDQLLKLGDASAAVPYYERALAESSDVSIGATIIAPLKGFLKAAEVDCVEDTTMDLTIMESGEEITIPRSSSGIVGIMEPDDEKLQERILLNLSRCMIHLSDIDTVHRPSYLKSAVLGCSIVIGISKFRSDHGTGIQQQQQQQQNHDNHLPTNQQTALYIRAKAQTSLSKWQHAIADAKQLLKIGNSKGQQLLDNIHRQKKLRGKQDKKLAKEVCKWVQTATNDSVSSSEQKSHSPDKGKPSRDNGTISLKSIPSTAAATKAQPALISRFVFFVVLPLAAAFLIQNFLFDDQEKIPRSSKFAI